MNNTNEIAGAVAAAAECKFVLEKAAHNKLTFRRGSNEKLIFILGKTGDAWAYQHDVESESGNYEIEVRHRAEDEYEVSELRLHHCKSYGFGQMRILGTGPTIGHAISVALDQRGAMYERLCGR
jgi:hypothetical protein